MQDQREQEQQELIVQQNGSELANVRREVAYLSLSKHKLSTTRLKLPFQSDKDLEP